MMWYGARRLRAALQAGSRYVHSYTAGDREQLSTFRLDRRQRCRVRLFTTVILFSQKRNPYD